MFICPDSSRDLHDYLIPCLGDSSHKFYAVPNNFLGVHDWTSCTKIDDITSVPLTVFSKNDLHLSWSAPECGRCEAQGESCSLKYYTRGNQIQCIDEQINHGASKGPLIAGESCPYFSKYYTFLIEKFLEHCRALKPTRFSYSDIRRITHQFSEKLGEGGHEIVYKGKLSDEINVAIKVLKNSKGNGEEFVNEVGAIGRRHHVNVVCLIGFCAEGLRRALVYEFLPSDSLEKFIFQAERNSLDWKKLQDIALIIAEEIEYLHQGCDQWILHFDIKPHNILLDHNFNPKICDFGLAKLCSKEQSVVIMTVARGTIGYIVPEVLSRTFGKVSYRSDVYSFGMLLLEMVGGRKNVDAKHLNVGEDIWARSEEVEDGNITRKLSIVGLWCIQWHPRDWPSMKQVVQMLEGDEDNLTMPPNPFPDTNATNSIAGITGRRYQLGLPLIIEAE
ncbi:Serine/threonine protein kinase [Handroanthus impetiginosus]|uniref:non-specific serine/threonine protein kinase n=1 Tax=Handroanthus impetiginosus TaxID=429701 RepID=A0A2G9IBH5_9LAMI|nr:Serine/threonine protein kinase [Handroanthus impetiginosus]